ncbi:hypothetical protein ABK040_010391 [Willaertia magna]
MNNNNNTGYSMFCGEGNQLRNKPCIKVHQPAGGTTTYNFLTGEPITYGNTGSGNNSDNRASLRKKNEEITGKVGTASNVPKGNNAPTVSPKKQGEDKYVICDGQLRNRSSIRVHEKKDNNLF